MNSEDYEWKVDSLNGFMTHPCAYNIDSHDAVGFFKNNKRGFSTSAVLFFKSLLEHEQPMFLYNDYTLRRNLMFWFTGESEDEAYPERHENIKQKFNTIHYNHVLNVILNNES